LPIYILRMINLSSAPGLVLPAWCRWLTTRSAVAAACVGGVLAATGPVWVDPAAAADGGATTYANPSQQCQITDKRLSGASGIAAARGGLYVLNDKPPTVVYSIDSLCRISAENRLKVTGTDTEDLAVAHDGTLWLGDIGGNNAPRQVVSLYHWSGTGKDADRFDLRYPDGPHDAEALLVSLDGAVVVVTKVSGGRSEVYSAHLPLGATDQLQKVAELDFKTFRTAKDTAPGSLLVTGGAVAPDGTHFVLRTYTAAYEWDSPDGDVVAALKRRSPRPIALAPTLQGEAITYSEDGAHLLTASERVPSPVHALTISRAAPAAPEGSSLVLPWRVLFGAGATLALIVALAALSWRRRATGRATTYQTGG
jgi:hypothetical protein